MNIKKAAKRVVNGKTNNVEVMVDGKKLAILPLEDYHYLLDVYHNYSNATLVLKTRHPERT